MNLGTINFSLIFYSIYKIQLNFENNFNHSDEPEIRILPMTGIHRLKSLFQYWK